MELKESVLEKGKIDFKDYISPAYVNTKNPKFIEIDRFILCWNYASRLQ